MRDRCPEQRAPEGSDDGAGQPIDRRFQQATYTRLHDNHGRQHRPIDLLDAEQFAECQGDQPGDSDAQAQRDFRAMRGDPVACFSDQISPLSACANSAKSRHRPRQIPSASSFSFYLRADRTDAQSSSTAIYTRVVQ